ncbi:hypothetical protein BGZ54_007132 [Gamsiella multidivaricata]|nr:hypothetical protein BGZ54_007132 [Gamsiella multidivaricata]
MSKNNDFFGPYPFQGAASEIGSASEMSRSGLGKGTESASGSKSESGARIGTDATTGSASNDQGTSSSPTSFQQRRKRSESIGGGGGFKSTAGTITRIVRKSSSNFLRKLVKSFDDRDAPPIPVMPSHNNNSTVSHQSDSSATASINNSVISSTTTAFASAELPPLTPTNQNMGFEPLENDPSISGNDIDEKLTAGEHQFGQKQGLLHPESAAHPIPIRKPSKSSDLDIELDQELSNSVSTVESWLKRSQGEAEESAAADMAIPTTSTTTADMDIIPTTKSTLPTSTSSTNTANPINTKGSEKSRRPSHASSTVSTIDDDDGSDGEDIRVPMSALSLGANRLSRLYEAESMQLTQSETSLYYSTKSTIEDETDLQGGHGGSSSSTVHKTTSLAANAARNSIRFSEFGLMPPSSPSNNSTDLPLILNSARRPEKPLPPRPVSLFIPLSTSTTFTITEDHVAKPEHGHTIETSLQTPVSSAHGSPASLSTHRRSSVSTPLPSSMELTENHLATPTSNNTLSVSGSRVSTGMRPATICVSPEEAGKLAPVAVSVTIRPLASLDMFLPASEPQEESPEALAQRTGNRCFQEDNTFLRRDEISIFLGQPKPFNRRVLRYYMKHFDFSGKRLDVAFRQLCQKLMLKGETQEVDRILEGFAQRFIDCNPQSVFGSKDVVHAITYSILLLNTDLHVVQQSSSSKMSRSAFVKNTLQAVQQQAVQQQQQDERASEELSAHGLPFTRSATGDSSLHGSGGKKKTPSVKSWKSGTSHQSKTSKMGPDPKANGGHGNGKWWMSELESLLKDIYHTVKHNQILLPTSKTTSATAPTTPTPPGFPHSISGSSLSSSRSSPGGGAGRLSRQVQPTSLALADSNHASLAGSQSNPGTERTRSLIGAMGRRNSVNARNKQLRQDAMQRLNAAQASEGGSPSTSPSLPSSARFGETLTGEGRPGNSGNRGLSTLTLPSSSSSSQVHYHLAGSPLPSPVSSVFSQHEIQIRPPHYSEGSIGTGGGGNPSHRTRFRMEGILFRKHLLERADKKASHRAWRQLLVVLDQGGLSLFRADGQLGQAFEEQGILFDEIRLQHTITNILPPPGYSSSRRHVFAVQLYTGAVYLFQAATARECEDWARICNYWAARTSKEPLPGGVINMDYGWGRSLELLANNTSDGAAAAAAATGEGGGERSGHNNTMISTTSGNSILSSLSTMSTSVYAASSSVMPSSVNNSSGSSLAIPTLTAPLSSAVSEDDDAKSVNSSIHAGVSFLHHPPPLPTPASSLTSTISSSTAPVSGGVGTAAVSSAVSTTTAVASGPVGSGPGSGLGTPYSFGNSGVGSGRSASIKSTSSKHSSTGGASIPLGDRVVLFEWTPPLPTMSMSQLAEEEQCEALKRYVVGLEAEMEVHQEHRIPMMKLFLPKSHNYAKAFNNWERRSRHLLKEMVKYQIYVECLEQSLQFQREEEATLEAELQHLEVEDDNLDDHDDTIESSDAK